MTLNLPPEIEAIAREKARQAGIGDVDQFVQRLIENASPEQACLPSPEDPRIVKAISDGLASEVAGVIDENFWQTRREELEAYLNAKQ